MDLECPHSLLGSQYFQHQFLMHSLLEPRYGRRQMVPLLIFHVTYWMSASIGLKHLLCLVGANSVDVRDHCIWHRYNIPTAPNVFLSCIERHTFKDALQVSTGPKRNGALCYGFLAIARSIFLMHITVLSNLETQLFFVINNITRYYGFWAQSIRNYTLC